MLIFDPVISIGAIIQVLTITGAAVVFVFGLQRQIDKLGGKVDTMAATLDQMRDVLQNQAVQNSRLERIEQDIMNIQHGESFVFPMNRIRPPEPDNAGG